VELSTTNDCLPTGHRSSSAHPNAWSKHPQRTRTASKLVPFHSQCKAHFFDIAVPKTTPYLLVNFKIKLKSLAN